jgi:membrane-bound ClpP family serine protease
VALVVALLLALYVLDEPWDMVVVLVGLAVEIGEIFFWLWYTKRRHAQVGAETLVGLEGAVVTPCRPQGQVRLQGEIWDARCEGGGAGAGERVRVVGRDGLTLLVEPTAPAPAPAT